RRCAASSSTRARSATGCTRTCAWGSIARADSRRPMRSRRSSKNEPQARAGSRTASMVQRAQGIPMTRSLEFDPLATRADPYPIYRRLRDEAPVHFNEERRIWSVTRYDDVLHVLQTPELFSSRAMFTMLLAGGRVKPPPLTFDLLRFL